MKVPNWIAAIAMIGLPFNLLVALTTDSDLRRIFSIALSIWAAWAILEWRDGRRARA